MSDRDIALSPAAIQAVLEEAVAHHQARRVSQAMAGYERVIAADPLHFDANLNLGVALRGLKRHADALAAYERALTAQPDNAVAHLNRANLLRTMRRHDEAIAAYDRSLALRPDAATYAARGGALADAGRPEAACRDFDTALELDPTLVGAHNGRGSLMFAMGRLDEALAHYDRAVALDPTLPLSHRNRGVTLRRLRRLEEAIQSHDQALALAPDAVDGYWYRGMCHLLRGDFDAGWRDYERRWDRPGFVANSPGDSTPALRARFRRDPERADVAGRSVLLVGEQGVGDVIMFASIIPDLLADATQVGLCCDPRLHGLFAQSFPALSLLDKAGAEARLDTLDTVMGIGSLPSIYRRQVGDFAGAPYLSPGAAACQRWTDRLGAGEGRKRIGLSWRGGVARTGRAERSVPLQDLKPILDLPACEVISLQYGAHDAEIEAVNRQLARPVRTFPAAEIDDFQDLAALVGRLDLVVTVQTALAHLAGATGVPTLVMVQAAPEWRYMAEGSSMPWYRALTLIRQGADAHWEPVIQQVTAQATQRLGLA